MRTIVLIIIGILLIVLFISLASSVILLKRITHEIREMEQALDELGTMPLKAWERKWSKYVQDEYDKCNDPYRDEIEADMKFFEACRKED
jgi:hypothetical protein